LAIAHRKIKASRSHIGTNRSHKKAIPTTPKTLGDHILLKRFEKGLSQRQLAHLLEVPTSQVIRWENDARLPTEPEWRALAVALSLESGLIQWKSNTKPLVGNLPN
jgi:DNA-binding transcriptional regulator YiaG